MPAGLFKVHCLKVMDEVASKLRNEPLHVNAAIQYLPSLEEVKARTAALQESYTALQTAWDGLSERVKKEISQRRPSNAIQYGTKIPT